MNVGANRSHPLYDIAPRASLVKCFGESLGLRVILTVSQVAFQLYATKMTTYCLLLFSGIEMSEETQAGADSVSLHNY